MQKSIRCQKTQESWQQFSTPLESGHVRRTAAYGNKKDVFQISGNWISWESCIATNITVTCPSDPVGRKPATYALIPHTLV
ncbi:hypothetical protein J6590_016922 [Homalodisca vitripennis]|nr:hypothetical protein J6590_016922 [Homalodisca vitripennis]